MRRFFLLGLTASIILSVLVAPFSHAATTRPYVVSIGDSVAAGVGLPAASGENNQLCGRSRQAYPFTVARQINAGKILHVPCTGAKTDDGIYKSQTVGSVTKSPQLQTAFAFGRPDIMLVTIGANDMRWRYFAGKCYYETCGTVTDRAQAAAYLADVYAELSIMIRDIDRRSGGAGNRPQIYLSGYYNPLTDSTCAPAGTLTDAERTWLGTQVTRLNNAIRRTADLYQDVEYVPVDFRGHGICSSEPWIQPVSRTSTGALHPTAAGQQAIAGAFTARINQ